MALHNFDKVDTSNRAFVVHQHGDTPSNALIVLIHGLGGDRYKTWTPPGKTPVEASLPKFLYDEFAGLDVGLYSYQTLRKRFFGLGRELPMEARVLADYLRDDGKAYRILVLAGHSMGGILARAVVAELIARNDTKTLARIKGLLLLATPIAGSQRVPRVVRSLTADARALRPHGEIVTNSAKLFTDRVVAEPEHVKEVGQFFIPSFVLAAADDRWVDDFSSSLGVPSKRRRNLGGTHVTVVKPRSTDDAEYTWIRDQIREIVEVGSRDDFDACVLRGKLFINRQPLRQALRDMVDPDGTTRVLAVRGPSRSGKSHSIYLIEHGQETYHYDKVEVSLGKSDSPVTYTPTMLAQSIIDQIGGDATRLPLEPKGVTEPRWLEQITDYVVGQIKSKFNLGCLVLDGFADANLHKLTRDLVQTFVRRADREPKLRLVLLDYNEDLLSRDIAGRLATEPIGSFTDDDLRTFITKYATAQRLPQPSAEAITIVVNAIVAALPSGKRDDNEQVALALEPWAQRLKGAPRDVWNVDKLAAIARDIAATAPPGTTRDETFHAAAALVSWFVIDPAIHTGSAAAHLIEDSLPVAGGEGRRSLTRESRTRTLHRLQTVAAMRQTLEQTRDRPNDLVQQTIESVVAGRGVSLELSRPALTASLQVIDWFSGTEAASKLPAADDVRSRIGLLDLIEPMKSLAGPHFRGRTLEIAALRAYVAGEHDGAAAGDVQPLLVFGPGGMGKSTLLAHFLLDTLEQPFVYLDCDRPGLSAEEPITLLAEAVRQLGLQFPNFAAAAGRLRSRWIQEVSSRYTDAVVQGRPRTIGRQRHLDDFRVFVQTDLGLGARTVVLVIDTFEEVQYRSAAAASEIALFLGELRHALPQLRAIVAGRNSDPEHRFQPMELGVLDDESADAILENLKITSPDVRRSLVRLLRGNPLSLRLAADVLKVKADGALDDLEGVTDDTEIQAVLYNRILGHIHEEDVRRIAHPGLILRRITADIIHKVLAGPCGLGAITEAQATVLFNALSRELSLVTVEGDAVRHRADVRRVMLPALKNVRGGIVREVEEAAVGYYANRDDLTSRAEEIYHRLSLGQPRSDIDARWLPGIEVSLHSAIEEIDGEARRTLAAKLGVDLDETDWDSASAENWETYAAKRAVELLQLDRPFDAVRILRRRSTRLPGSPLRWLQARALSRCGQLVEARELARQVIGDALGHADWMKAYDARGYAWAVQQILEWFPGSALVTAPSPEEIQIRFKWLQTLQPLHLLAGKSFVGRHKELAVLASYVTSADRILRFENDPRPLLIVGAGGTGKSTLVAKFLLDRVSTTLLVYLDCETLLASSASNEGPMGSLLAETVRQLGMQIPRAYRESEGWARQIAHDPKRIGPILQDLFDNRPLVLVVDAVDQLVYRSPDALTRLYSYLATMQASWPPLRTILTSRYEFENLPHQVLNLSLLDDEAADAFLATAGVPPEIRPGIHRIAQGNPTTMRLAVELFKKEGTPSIETFEALPRATAINDMLVSRVLGHVRNSVVRRLAMPAMLLRRITPELIQRVLAPGSDVPLDSAEQAMEAFDEARQERALFQGDDVLRPRPDVRRILMPSLRRSRPLEARRLDELAVRYYEQLVDSASRAEEIYHRLMLGQDAATIDARWIQGIDLLLRDAIDDVSGPARAYLAARLGWDDGAIEWEIAEQPVWERYVARRTRELISSEGYSDALSLLRQRSTRRPHSALFALEAEVLLRMGQPDEALLLARRGLTLWPDDPALPKLIAECEQQLGPERSRPSGPAPSRERVASYRLLGQVRPAELAEALAHQLPTASDLMFVARALSAEDFVSPQPTVQSLVEWAMRQGRLNELITAAAQHGPLSSEFKDFLDRAARREESQEIDPTTAIRLSSGALFFGRSILREFLRDVASNVRNYSVLIVNGPPGSGKTHTFQLARHIANTTGAFTFAAIHATLDDRPETFVARAFDELGWRKDQSLLLAESLESPHRRIRDLVDFLTIRARDDRHRILLMVEIDGDTQRDVVDCVRELIGRPEPLTLIVTGFAVDLVPAEALPRIRVETIGELSKGELSDVIAVLTRDFGQRSDFTEMATDSIYTSVSPGPRFNRDLAAAVDSFFSTGRLPTRETD